MEEEGSTQQWANKPKKVISFSRGKISDQSPKKYGDEQKRSSAFQGQIFQEEEFWDPAPLFCFFPFSFLFFYKH
jgi:hypothetical protein